MEISKPKRQRVSKGPYNRYLKKPNPMQHAPLSSKRRIRQAPCENVTLEGNISETPEEAGCSPEEDNDAVINPVGEPGAVIEIIEADCRPSSDLASINSPFLESEADTFQDSEIDTFQEAETDTFQEPETDTFQEPEPETDTFQEPEPEIDTFQEPEPETYTFQEPEPEIDTFQEPETDTFQEPEPEIETFQEPEINTFQEPEPETDTFEEPEHEIDTFQEPESDTFQEPETDTIQEPETDNSNPSQLEFRSEEDLNSAINPGAEIGFANNDIEMEEEGEENFENVQPEKHFSDSESEKLFYGSKLSLGSFMVLLITFILKYSLTGEALGDLLKLFDLVCPSDNILITSIATFKKWFQHIKHPMKVHKYCSFCHVIIDEADLIRKNCPVCKKALDESNLSHFIEIPIAEQIKSFFSRPTFLSDIEYRFKRKKRASTSIEDIYDGEVYKNLSRSGGFLENPHNLSLLWNTDGIPCFKSSNMSLWPLFFQINELQYSKRINPDNMILGGLWFGPKKPTMISYTEPFVKTLQDLEKNGVQVSLKSQSFISKVAVIGGTADLPAKSIVCNTIQFNGKYGCSKCLQPGETCKTSQRGHCHIFPFKEDNPSGPRRSHNQYLENVDDSVKNNVISKGIKGPSFLQCLSYYDLVKGTCIDYMHGVLLGVQKLLMSLWFLSDHSGAAFSLSAYVGLVDKRLNYLKPSNNISRLPRAIKDHLKYWKASEFKSWMLYYSLPLLRDLQTEEYFQHYLLFVNAMYILLQDSITPSDLNKSEALLTHFGCLFAALYGDRYMTCNVHQLIHLPEMVRQMGPMWAYSCFPFENANGNVLKLFNGTQNVDFQIVETVSLMQTLPKLQMQFLKPNSPEDILYQTMKGIVDRNDIHLQDNIYLVGGSGKRKLNVKELEAVSQFLGHIPEHYLTFKRIRIGKEIFHSKSYVRVHARNSYTVAFRKLGGCIQICQVAFYMQLFLFCDKHQRTLCKCKSVNLAVVNLLKSHSDLNLSTLSRDQLSGADIAYINVLHPASCDEFFIVPLDKILYKCVLVEIEDKKDTVYACKMPNNFEKD